MAKPADIVPLSEARKARKRRGEGGGDNGGDGGGDRRPPSGRSALAGCPVVPIGHDAALFYFFTPAGQVKALRAHSLGQSAELVALFGGAGEGVEWLRESFPQFDREGQATNWFSAREAGAWLVAQCFAAGILREDEPRRGPGVWRGEAGPIVHVGDAVRFYAGEAGADGLPYSERRAGFRAAGALWPAHAPLAPPDRIATAGEAARLETYFERWHWRTAEGAAIFYGLWSAGLLGAAIRWRAHGLVVGPPGSGKSTLLELYEAASPLAAVVNDYTEAGLRQAMSQRAAPLILDEAEGDDRGRLSAVIRLLRKASGGGGARVLRGSADGTPQRFDVSSPAVLGGVLPPTLEPQDETRITRLDLAPRAEGGPSLPSLEDVARVRGFAPKLWSRALAGLPRFAANLAGFRAEILGRGCPPRLADQIGTILAARAMMLADAPLAPADIEEDCDRFARAGFVRSEGELAAEQGPALCLAHLLQSPADMTEHGERPSIAQLLARARGPLEEEDARHAGRVLVAHGVKVARYPMSGGADAPWCLWVAFSHPRLRRLFGESRWSEGRWHEDLRNLPGAVVPRDPVHIGAKVRAVAVPLELVLEGLEAGARPAPAPAGAAQEPPPDPPPVQACGGCFWFAPDGRTRGRCFSGHQAQPGASTMRAAWCPHWKAKREGDTSPPPSPPSSPP